MLFLVNNFFRTKDFLGEKNCFKFFYEKFVYEKIWGEQFFGFKMLFSYGSLYRSYVYHFYIGFVTESYIGFVKDRQRLTVIKTQLTSLPAWYPFNIF
jgi:hypothetical protein